MSTQNTLPVAPASQAQIGHILDMWKKRLEERTLTTDEAQVIITGGDIYVPVMEQGADLLVNKVRSDKENTLIRMVRNIRRNRTAVQAINDTGRVQYVDSSVVATMPTGDGPEDTEMTYFRACRFLSDDELEQEFGSRKLVPDPQAQAADNEADPTFANEHPNGIHWKNKKGQWCFATFDQDGDERCVGVYRDVSRWDVGWWFAGRRKS